MHKGVEMKTETEIRADERKKAERDFQNSDYWNEYLEQLIANVRADEQAFVEKRCKELGIDYIQIYTCNSAD